MEVASNLARDGLDAHPAGYHRMTVGSGFEPLFPATHRLAA